MYVTEYVNEVCPLSTAEVLNILLGASKVNKPGVSNILIVHDTDPDGITAAAIMVALLKRNMTGIIYIDVTGVHHGKYVRIFSETGEVEIRTPGEDGAYSSRNNSLPSLDIIQQYETVFILDHEYCREIADLISGNGKTQVIYVDHHAITPEDVAHIKQHPRQYYIGPSRNILPCDSTTGIVAELLRTYIGQREVAPLNAAWELLKVATLVDLYDAWKFVGEDYVDVRETVLNFAEGCFCDISKLCYLVGKLSDFTAAGLKSMPSWFSATASAREIMELGKTSLFIKAKVIEKVVSSGPCILEHPGVKIGLVYHSDSYSLIAEKLFEHGYDVALIATIKNGEVRYSVRSREGSLVTARDIALLNGGGGHMHSAGFIKKVNEAIVTKGV